MQPNITWDNVKAQLQAVIPGKQWTEGQAIAPDQLGNSIEARKPVLVGITYNNDFVVLNVVGYQAYLWNNGQIYWEFLVSDPDYKAIQTLNLDQLTSYGGGSWSNTIYESAS